MMLRDADIIQLGMRGFIFPFDEKNVNPVSYDVTLGNDFYKMVESFKNIRPYESVGSNFFSKKIEIADDEVFVIKPHEAVLATTKEHFVLPSHLAAELMGKSTLGRWFLSIHVTAGLVDAGFEGNLTLEIVNLGNNNIELKPNMRIGQMVFHKLYNSVHKPYGIDSTSHYQRQKNTTLPWG